MRKQALLLCAITAVALFGEEIVKVPVNNDDIRIADVVVQPGEKTRLHKHDVNRVMIYKVAGAQDFDYEGGKHSTLKFGQGEVKWSPIDPPHVAVITSAKPVGIVEIELKKRGAGKKVTTALDPPKVAPGAYQVEFENDQVRVIRVKIAPHQSIPMHEHQLKRIVVYLTDARTKTTSADGKVEEAPHKAGDIGEPAPIKHSEINMLDTPVEIVVTELKY